MTATEGAPAFYLEAHDQLTRALFFLRLEISESIVADIEAKALRAVLAGYTYGYQQGLAGLASQTEGVFPACAEGLDA